MEECPVQTSTRTRHVQEKAVNSSKGSTVNTTVWLLEVSWGCGSGCGCEGCKELNLNLTPESAMILPAKYSELEDQKYDVRQNLRTFKEEENDGQ
jgi:hypothetical protein